MNGRILKSVAILKETIIKRIINKKILRKYFYKEIIKAQSSLKGTKANP